ncbi:hypothetical protein CSC17_3119 [Klebsiella oxytoca]|nr:hypothetical protein CSC17_3119 [Klebsiella oxytoca]
MPLIISIFYFSQTIHHPTFTKYPFFLHYFLTKFPALNFV